MSKRDRPEIIEVIQPESSTSGRSSFVSGSHTSASWQGADPPVEPPARQLWIVPAAIAAVIAVVVGASAISDDGSTAVRSAPATSQSSATSTTAVVAPIVQVLPDTPAGFVLESIATADPHTTGQSGQRVRELWASDTSTVTRSAWFLITATTTEPANMAVGDFRIPLPTGVAVIDRRSGGDYELIAPIRGGWVNIVSSGLGGDLLQEALGSMQLVANRLLHDHPLFHGTFQPVAVDRSDGFAGAIGTGDVAMTYRSETPVRGNFSRLTVTVGRQASEYERLSREFFLTRRDEIELSTGARVEIGADSRAAGVQTMMLDHEGTQVTIEGNVDREILAAAASTLHAASAEELAVLERVPKVIAAEPDSGPRGWAIGEGTLVSQGTLSNGSPWAVSLARSSNESLVIDLVGAPGRSATTPVPARQPFLTAVATSDFTAIVGLFDPAAGSGTLRVRYSGESGSTDIETLSTVISGMPGQLQPVALAAHAFVETGGYEAELLDASGAVLASIRG